MEERQVLEKLNVVELGTMVSGPYCGKMLADMGAEVIKVEHPGTGDDARRFGPFPDDVPHPEKSGMFLGLNTNKMGITLDVDTATGQDVLRRLLKDCDVLVINKSPSYIESHGLTYDALKNINPRIIVSCITPFGMTGPYRDYKAYNINISASAGVSTGNGYPDREPLQMPLEQCKFQAGIAAMLAIMMGLLARLKDDVGRGIDVSEDDVMSVLHTGSQVLTYIFIGVTGGRQGRRGTFGNYPSTVLPSKDGWVVLTAPQVAQWIRFLNVLGNPEWTKNPRYRNRRKMKEEYSEEVDALIQPWFSARTGQEILQASVENHIPFVPVMDAEEVFNEPHLATRNYWRDVEHPVAGTLRYPGPPYRLSPTPWEIRRPAPTLGQHNEEIYTGRLGYSKQDLVEMRRTGII